jgi:hypothetical protein
MSSRSPSIEIQRSMKKNYHTFAKSHPLISVTFSTPTPYYTHNNFPLNFGDHDSPLRRGCSRKKIISLALDLFRANSAT